VRPAGGREVQGELLVELPRHEFLPDRVPQSAEIAEPRVGPAVEAGVAGDRRVQSLAPRATCGLGSLSRRIWSVRIRP
jgi:hypothetical protein